MSKQYAYLRVARRLAVLIVTIFSMLPFAATGRENSVTAGLALREGYDSNIRRTDENHVLQWTTTITPSLDFLSLGQTDRLSLSYAPGLRVVDHESAEPGVDKPANFKKSSMEHALTINAEKFLGKDFQVLLSEYYVKSDDPDLRPRLIWEPESGVYISENVERGRYWTNAASLAMLYTYAQDSTLAIAYVNSRFEQEEAQQAGSYERHLPTVTISHRINEQWRTVAGYAYTKADFQQAEAPLVTTANTDDLVSHNPTLEVDYIPWLHSTVYGLYSFQKFDFQNDLKDDYQINEGRLGWRQAIGPQSNVDLSAGYAKTDWDAGGSVNAFSYEGHFVTTRGQATLSFGAAKGFDARYYEGTSSGLSEYWLLQAAIKYQHTQNLATDLSVSYREDKFLEEQQDIDEDVIQAAAGLSYKLGQWASLSLRYIFRDRTTAGYIGASRDYDAHRLFLELKTSKELWRW